MTNRYVHGDQVDEPWVQYESAAIGSSNWRFLHADHQGSIIARSTAVGALQGNALSYDSYGIPKTTNQGRFGYTGQAWLKELGLFHYKARVYSPKLGRFLQTDPIFYADGMNMYAYTGNDPLNNTDPTGLKNCPDGATNCTESPESENTPNEGEPPKRKPEVDEVEEIVVTGHRNRDAGMRFNITKEMFFTADNEGLTSRKLEQSEKKCSNGKTMTVGRFKEGLSPGQAAVHTHSKTHEQIPGPGDGAAARQSTIGAAFVMTGSRVFTIEAMSNGSFRTTLQAGGSLSDSEKSTLSGYMQQWENPTSGGGCN